MYVIKLKTLAPRSGPEAPSFRRWSIETYEFLTKEPTPCRHMPLIM